MPFSATRYKIKDNNHNIVSEHDFELPNDTQKLMRKMEGIACLMVFGRKLSILC